MKSRLEIACFNTASAIIAQESGAHRIEFCADMSVGGVTPAIEETRALRKQLEIDLYIMIRPRGGNFVYTDAELSQMEHQICEMKALGVNGVVFGVLLPNHQLDMERNKKFISLAAPLPCTLHRAFDSISDMDKSIDDAVACGFSTILTSGKKENVTDGLENLKELVRISNGRIEIMPGGGLRSSNIERIKKETPVRFLHSSAVIRNTTQADKAEIQRMVSYL